MCSCSADSAISGSKAVGGRVPRLGPRGAAGMSVNLSVPVSRNSYLGG